MAARRDPHPHFAALGTSCSGNRLNIAAQVGWPARSRRSSGPEDAGGGCGPTVSPIRPSTTMGRAGGNLPPSPRRTPAEVSRTCRPSQMVLFASSAARRRRPARPTRYRRRQPGRRRPGSRINSRRYNCATSTGRSTAVTGFYSAGAWTTTAKPCGTAISIGRRSNRSDGRRRECPSDLDHVSFRDMGCVHRNC